MPANFSELTRVQIPALLHLEQVLSILLDDFTKIVTPLWKMTISGEIINLTKQRDELLPLLMNGQVSVE